MPHDDGGGAGGNKDRFYFMDVSTMWDMLQHHDSAPHQQALKGWRQSYELVLIHKTQVEKYKEKLITAWPPERSKAARAYVERLDHLIESLGETFEAAIANYTAYSTAIAAVDDAKRKLAEIQQEHTANAAAIAKHDDEVRNTPRAYGKAIAPPPPPSPVADGRQEQLRLQAAGLMTGLSAELATAQMSLTAPKPYSFGGKVERSGEGFDPSTPTLPTLTPPFFTAATSPARASRPSTSRPGARIDLKNPGTAKGEQPGAIKKPSEGPILGGAKPQKPSQTWAPSVPLTTMPPTAPTSPPAPFPGMSATTLPRLPETSGRSAIGGPLGAPQSISGTRSQLPFNGSIIGGTPPMVGAPSTRAGQQASGSRATQRVNPLGGVIGQNTPTLSSRRTTPQHEKDAGSQFGDADNPWEAKDGVAPVLLPQPEQKIVPGPTIDGR